MIANGTWTVKSPSGEHRTFKISTWKKELANGVEKRSVGLLIGQDNENDFLSFGFVNGDRINVFHKFRGTQYEKLARALEDLFSASSRLMERGMQIEGAACCRRCNRKLTHPESLETGYGPECGNRI